MMRFTRYFQDETTNTAAYEAERYALLLRVEESGDPKELPYADSDGTATIGIGFNLRVKRVRNAVLDELGFNRTDPADLDYINEIIAIVNRNYKNKNTQLQRDLNDVMTRRWADPNVAGTQGVKRPTFEFEFTQEIHEVFDTLVKDYEDQVDTWLPGIPRSTERVALVSLAWNGILAKSGSLNKALVAGDRAEAWYEIRYSSNADGINANRRYKESDLFGLYNEDATEEDYKAAFRMYTRHRDSNIYGYGGILRYEAHYNPAGAVYDGQDVPSASIKTNLSPASTYLINTYSQGVAIAWDHIFIGEDASTVYFRKSDSDAGQFALNGTNGNDLIFGESGDDKLSGGAGQDVLYGGTGNDRLAGGIGDDVLYGGKGVDTYKFSPGDGNDILVDEDGKGRILIGNNALREATHRQGDPDNVYKTLDGHTLSLSGNTLTVAVKDNGGSITVQNFTDHPDRLGIDLKQDSQAYNAASLFQAVFAYVGKAAGGIVDYLLPAAHAAPNAIEAAAGITETRGTSGDDTIVGGSLPGSEQGHDLIWAKDGNDVVYADPGVDIRALVNANNADSQAGIPLGVWNTVYGGAGEDLLVGGSARDLLAGEAGHDVVIGGDGSDDIWGDGQDDPALDGNDLVYAGPGDDKVWAGGGEDVVFAGSGNDNVNGNGGRDYLFGEAGNDKLAGDSLSDTLLGNAYDDYLDGGAGDDELRGMSGADEIYGGTGNDLLVGDDGDLPAALQGADYLDGGEGDDTLFGQGDSDTLFGGAGNDTLYGDGSTTPLNLQGNDYLDGEDGDDRLIGDGGNDGLFGGSGKDELQGGLGDDYLDGEEGDDRLFGGEGADVLFGGAGADQLVGDAGDDALDGEDGDDQLFGAAGEDTLDGGLGNDRLQAGEGNDTLWGGDGADLLFGEAGNDTLMGDTGNDELLGGAGDDVLTGGTGDDALYGEAGDDIYVFNAGDGMDTIDDTEGVNRIRFGAGIALKDLTLGQASGTSGEQYLTLQYGTTDKLSITNGLVGAIQSYEFANGSVLTHAELMQRAPALFITGTVQNDVIEGGPQNDTLSGKAGDDLLRGSAGNDTLYGGRGSDALEGGEGDDRLFGYDPYFSDGPSENDTLDGGHGNDVLFGGLGNDTYIHKRGDGADTIGETADTTGQGAGLDTLRLGAGILPEHIGLYRSGADLVVVVDNSPEQIVISYFFADAFDARLERFVFDNGNGPIWDLAAINARVIAGAQNAMTGTAGDDTFRVDHLGDTVTEAADSGTDTIESWVSYSLPDNVENLTLTGPLNLSGTGNALDNVIRGNSGNNVLDGREGYDTAYGGAGDDIYKNIEAVIENPGEGIDTWVSRNGGVLPANVENLSMDDGSGFHSIFNVSAIGNALDNTLTSGGVGVIGDILDGREGADTMIATGSDSPIFVVDNPGDKVIASSSGGSNDKVISSIDYTLGAYLEDLTLSGTQAISGTGNALNNTLDGSANSAPNVLSGGTGNDTYILGTGDRVIEAAGEGNDTVRIATSGADDGRTYRLQNLNIANVEIFGLTGNGRNVSLIGDAQANTLKANSIYSTTLIGGAGDDSSFGGTDNDRLDGGTGADTLYGGGGSDTYVVDDTGDRIYDYDTGYDTVVSSISYTLGGGLERLVLTGVDAINGTGNALSNQLDGSQNTAANVLAGGAGDDQYIIGAGDSVIEDPDGGIDEVWSSVSIASLAVNVENVVLMGQDADHLSVTGNALDNRIQGDFGDNSLSGGDGNDTLIGSGGNDTLEGGVGNDTLEGDQGDDLLDGGTGDDTYLWGWASGKDTIDSSDASVGKRDVVQVSESSGNVTVVQNGDDLVLNIVGTDDQLTIRNYFASTHPTTLEEIQFSDGALWRPSEVAAKFIRGTAGNDTLTGTAANDNLAGLGGDDTLSGGAGHDILSGDAGADTLYGEAGNDTLQGGAGSDVLDGGLGADSLSGGPGDDTYIIDDAGDVVTENPEAGTDTIKSSMSYTLAANVENLILTGTATLNGTGNALDNALTGNGAKNTLSGGAGNDTLDGGSNADTLTGGAGNDTLNGGAGADKLAGGVGDDTYVVDSSSDVVTEYLNEGMDSVRSMITYTLGANVENLTLNGTGVINGTGNALNNVIYGNSANNTLTAGSGDDLVNGGLGAGADTLNGDAGNDVLEGMGGIDTLKDSGGNNLFNGGAGNDSLTGNSGNEVYIGGAGNDTITTGSGADIIAFNRGDGQDVVNASAGADNTVSLGGGIRYQDLSLRKSVNDLILDAGASEQITFKDWYSTSANNKSVVNLQMIADAMADFDAASTDALRNNKIEQFSFAGLAERFDQARAADASLRSWSLTNALLDFHLGGSDTEALGGDLAYQYGHAGTLARIGLAAAQANLVSPQFGSAPQTLQPLASLQQGQIKLG